METLIGGGAPDAADLVKDSDTANFEKDVIQASQETPVIVDFWATWCGPCKELGPLIEKLVTEARGKVKLVKIDVDKNQALAQQLRIQSIPAVYAFKGGRPVDGFVGALPESQLRQFIETLTKDVDAPGGDPVAEALEQAKATLDGGDAASAGQLYARILDHDPENLKAIGGLARASAKLGEVEHAKEILSTLPAEADQDPDIAAARSAIELAEMAAQAGDLSELKAKVDANPGDLQSRLDYANALYARGETEPAIEELLEIIRRDRAWNDEAARKQIVKIFDALGPSHPTTTAGRRRLSSVLFS